MRFSSPVKPALLSRPVRAAGRLAGLSGLALLAAALVPGPLPHASAEEGSHRAELEERYRALAAALRDRSVPRFTAVLARDYSGIDAKGTYFTRGEAEARLERDFAGRETDAARFTVHAVDAAGEEARVEVRVHNSGAREPGRQRRPPPEEVRRWDTWAITPDGWKLRYSRGVGDEQAARMCASYVVAAAAAESAYALRHDAYTADYEQIVQVPEGLTAIPRCPLTGQPIRLELHHPGPGDLTIRCPDAPRHRRGGPLRFALTLAAVNAGR